MQGIKSLHGYKTIQMNYSIMRYTILPGRCYDTIPAPAPERGEGKAGIGVTVRFDEIETMITVHPLMDRRCGGEEYRATAGIRIIVRDDGQCG